MIQHAQSQISIVSEIGGLFYTEQSGLLDLMLNHPKREFQFRIITEVPHTNE